MRSALRLPRQATPDGFDEFEQVGQVILDDLANDRRVGHQISVHHDVAKSGEVIVSSADFERDALRAIAVPNDDPRRA